MYNNLTRFFYPKSIALIGVSQNTDKLGAGRTLKYLVDSNYKGQLYPINPKYNDINGVLCYKTIKEIPDNVDVALISLPVQYVMEYLKEFGEKNIKNIIIFTSGFAESGTEEGKRYQEELKDIKNKYNLNIIGPNGQGVANLIDRIPLTFSTALENQYFKTKGNIAMISQSGAIGSYLLELSKTSGIDIGMWVSTGNEVDLDFTKIAQYLIQKEEVKVISGYIEGINDKKEFDKLVYLSKREKKPIILLKVGRTEAGAEAALSHTASMTGADEIYDTYFNQNNIIRVNGLNELLDNSKMFSKVNGISGNRIAIITTSGGVGVMAVDYLDEYDLEIAQFSENTIRQLRQINKNFQIYSNPLDIGAVFHFPGVVEKYIDVISEDENVDCIMYFSGAAHGMGPRIANEIVNSKNKSKKPVIVTWIASSQETKEIFINENIPFYDDPYRTIKVVNNFVAFHRKINNNIIRETVNNQDNINNNRRIKANSILDSSTSSIVSERKSKEILSLYNIPSPLGELATDVQKGIVIANSIGYPVVMKIESLDITHKTEASGVVVNVQNEKELKEHFEAIIKNAKDYDESARIEGVYIQQMVPSGFELILGVSSDITFNKYLLLGRGGIEAEIYKDVARKVLPFNIEDMNDLINELKVEKILKGYRNMNGYDVKSLKEMINNLTILVHEIGDNIKELDLNPVRVFADGITALDARIIKK